jgi:hypothetical protein
MTATIIRLRQRNDPVFRAMAAQLIAAYFHDGDAALMAHYCRHRLDKRGPVYARRLVQAVQDLIDEAGSPR